MKVIFELKNICIFLGIFLISKGFQMIYEPLFYIFLGIVAMWLGGSRKEK